jgi:hypothetical protein
MIMKLKEEARAHEGCRASEKKISFVVGECYFNERRVIFVSVNLTLLVANLQISSQSLLSQFSMVNIPAVQSWL